MIKQLLFIGYGLGLLSLISCSKDGLKSPTASFLVANSASLNVTSTTQGSNSQKITDLWFYVNDQFQGCYPIGGVMPIKASGSADIKLFAGIRNNGIGETRQQYCFFKPVSFTQVLDAGVTYTINPVFEYNSSAHFVFTEGFEGGGTLFMNDVSSTNNSFVIITNPSLVYSGAKSLYMTMTDNKNTSKIISSTAYAIPLSGARVYLEMNYKCNQEISIGVIASGEERTAITLNPSDNWNKIYIDLTTVVNIQPTASYYYFFISATKKANNPEIYIDNVKVITE